MYKHLKKKKSCIGEIQSLSTGTDQSTYTIKIFFLYKIKLKNIINNKNNKKKWGWGLRGGGLGVGMGGGRLPVVMMVLFFRVLMSRWETALLPWDRLCSPWRIAWEGDRQTHTQTNIATTRQSGPRADSVKIGGVALVITDLPPTTWRTL